MRASLLWAGGVFLAFQLGTGAILDSACPLVRFPTAALLFARLKQAPTKPDIVCLGSSRFGSGIHEGTAQGILLKHFGKTSAPVVFNGATPWGDVITSDFVLQQLLGAGVVPRLLIVEISWESLQRRNRWIHAHLYREVRWQDIPKCWNDIASAHQLVRLLGGRLLPLYVYRQDCWRGLAALLPETAAADSPTASSGALDWQKIIAPPSPDTRETASEARQRDREMVAGWLSAYAPGGYATACLEQLLEISRQHGIAVVLAGVPVSSDYRSMATPEIDQAFRTTIDRMCETYGCRFVDYRDRIPDDQFGDIHHLKQAGALQFTEMLSREVLVPAWADLHP